MEINKQTSFLREHIKCPICFEEFSNIHKPLIIPCGHTICSICVENIKKMTEEDYDEDEYRSDMEQEEEYDISLDTDDNQDNNESQNDDHNSDDSQEDSEAEEEEDEDEDEYGNETNSVESESLEPAPFGNIIQNSHIENKKDKKIRFKCSICRKKMKIMESEIIQNKSIINIIDSYQNPQNEGKKEASKNLNKKIFCKLCRYVDLESNHLVKFSSHNNFVVDLESENVLKNLKLVFGIQENDHSLNISQEKNYQEEIKKSLFDFYDYITNQDNITKYSNDYFKNYFKVNSKAAYIKYKSYKKLTALYNEFEKVAQEIEKSKKYEESLVSLRRKEENILKNTDKLLQKYYKIINVYFVNYNLILGESSNNPLVESQNKNIEDAKLIKIHLNKIIEKLFYDKCLKLLKDGFFQTYFNKIFTSERRYAICSNNSDNKLYIYDLRLENELEINFKNVFTSMESENEGEDFENLFSDYLEIDEDGRNIFILGERNKDSQNFFKYDLNLQELRKMEDMPIKFSSVDRICVNNKLFVLGGSNIDSVPLLECFYFDLESENWNEMPALNIHRYNKSIAYNKEKFYIFGGHSLDNESLVNKFEIIKLPITENSQWQTLTIINFNTILASYLYGFQSENIFVILGGQDYNEDAEKKGYFIDFSIHEPQVIEEFKLKNEMINSYSTCSSLRGILIGSPLGDGYFTKMNLRSNFKKLKTII
jgi:hypothetical protein